MPDEFASLNSDTSEVTVWEPVPIRVLSSERVMHNMTTK